MSRRPHLPRTAVRRTAFRPALAAAVAATLAAGLGLAPARAEIVPRELRFEPRGLDVAALCRPWIYEPPSRDWKTWTEDEPPGVPLLQMVEDADRLLTINPEQPVDTITARRLLEYVIAQNGPEAPRARRLLGEVLIDDDLDPDAALRGVAMLEKALAEGQVGAALTLAGVYERGGPVEADLNKAAALLRRAIAGGNGRAALRLARLYRSGAVAAGEAQAAEKAWKVGMAMEMGAIAAGECNELHTIGAAYLDDFAVYRDADLAFAWLGKSVDSKTYQAMPASALLARRRLTGDETPVDVPSAVALLDFSSARGNLQATHQLGAMLAKGEEGVAVDLARAAAVFDRGVKLLDGFSMVERGRLARGDYGGPADYALAIDLFRRATELPQPLPEAFVELGRMYADGLGVEKDPNAAQRLYDGAVNLGDAGAMLRLAEALAGEGGDIQMAIRLYRQAATLGRVDAMEHLVDLYRCGLGVAPEAGLAALWRDRAADAGSSRFLRERAAEAGRRGPAGAAERLRDLKHAALLGSRKAMVALAFIYERGEGVPTDPQRAALWLEKATAPGPDAAEGLAALAAAYVDGTAGPTDPRKALDLLDRATASGGAAARYALGSFLLSPRAGPLRDPKRGFELVRDAAAAGVPEAVRRLRALKQEANAAGDLTAAEYIVEASQKSDADEAVTGARRHRDAAAALAELAEDEAAAGCDADALLAVADAYAADPQDPAMRARAAAVYARVERAAAGDPEALYRVARAIREGAMPAAGEGHAARLLRAAAEAGYPPAMRALGEVLMAGEGVPAAPTEALAWYERAADAGDGAAAADLFALLVVMPDIPQARRDAAWARLMRAAEAGSPPAMREVGVRQQIGAGIAADPGAGFAWLERAAAAGDLQAMREIARSYAAGYGVAQSNEKSLAWLERAAGAGEPRAMYELALAFQAGLGGAADPERARALIDAAARAGYTP